MGGGLEAITEVTENNILESNSDAPPLVMVHGTLIDTGKRDARGA